MLQWQEEWAYNKYWVMAHSQQCYEQIRRLAKDNEMVRPKIGCLSTFLDKAARQVPTTQTLTDTYQHVWGYFKKICTTQEKQTYLQLLQTLSPQADDLEPFLDYLASKYQVTC